MKNPYEGGLRHFNTLCEDLFINVKIGLIRPKKWTFFQLTSPRGPPATSFAVAVLAMIDNQFFR